MTATYDPGEDGPAADDVTVNIHAVSSDPGQADQDSGALTFDGKGVATWTYHGTAGTDTITATSTTEKTERSTRRRSPTSGDFLDAALRLTPATATGTVGDTRCGGRRSDQQRRQRPRRAHHLHGDRCAEPTLHGTVATDTAGTATLPWTRPQPGTDHITATATYLGQPLTASATREWVRVPGPDLLTMTLSPPGVETPVNTPFTATAVVRLNGNVVDGAAVKFVASQAGEPDVHQAHGTTGGGIAEFPFTRTTAGDETITATTTVSGQTVTVSISHRWVETPGGGLNPNPVPVPVPVTPVTPGTPTPSTTTTSPPAPQGSITNAVAPPGGTTTLSGSGCAPGAHVAIKVADDQVGETTANDDGTFTASVEAPQLPLGRYVVTATCGGVVAAQGSLDLIGLTSTTGTAAAASVTSVAILTFLVLLLVLLVRLPGWRLGVTGR